MIASGLVAQTSVCAVFNLGTLDPFASTGIEFRPSNFVFRISLSKHYSAEENT